MIRIKPEPVARKKKRAVTKSRNIVTPPVQEQRGVGRPKTHATAADRQRAYRERQKEKA